MNKKHKVFLVDDHGVLRQGMKKLIDLEKDFEVCGEAADAMEALQRLPASKPDVALIDIGMKGIGGLDLIKNLKQRLPRLPILVMSMYEESLYAERALRAGAKGYIMKHEPADQVLAALRRVVSGKIYLSGAMSERMLDKLSTAEAAVSPTDVLSDRELEVFQHLGKGFKPAEIANVLHISVKTIETYREQIKSKLKLDNASELAQYAIAWARGEPQ
jgi:DNA-binding NarL/FixJ family response regulator